MDTVANKQTPNRDFLFPNEVSVTSFFLTSGVWGGFFHELKVVISSGGTQVHWVANAGDPFD